MEKLSIFIRGEAFSPDISRRYERVGRKVLTIDRCTQKKWVPDGRRSKRFTLQIYKKQRVRASSPCILFPYRPQQKHADAICIGVPPQSSTRIPQREHQAVERRHALPRRRGDTARPTQGDRRKPRERRRNPRSRRVGGAEKPSVLHPDPQRGRKAVEHLHQAVERRHALPQAKGPNGAAN